MKQALLLLAIGLPLFAGLAWATSIPTSGQQFPDGVWPLQKQPFYLQVYCDPTPSIEPSYEPYPLAADGVAVAGGVAPEQATAAGAAVARAPSQSMPVRDGAWFPYRSGFRFSLRYQCTASPVSGLALPG